MSMNGGTMEIDHRGKKVKVKLGTPMVLFPGSKIYVQGCTKPLLLKGSAVAYSYEEPYDSADDPSHKGGTGNG